MVLSKVKAFAIYFDNLNEHNLPVFSGGDQISGRVVVEVTEEVRVRSLNIHARGVAKVRWTESRNTGANTAYTQNYTEEVEYLNHYDNLIGEERGKGHLPNHAPFILPTNKKWRVTQVVAVAVCVSVYVSVCVRVCVSCRRLLTWHVVHGGSWHVHSVLCGYHVFTVMGISASFESSV